MNAKEPIRVVLADDHAIIRRGIRKILEKYPNIRVIGESSTGAGAIHLVQQLVPDVLLLDIEMPDMKGYHVAHALRAKQVPISILALSACDEGHFIAEAIQAGMDGYINKSEALTKVREAIHGIFQKRSTDPLIQN
jgi:NarL family two-component system response regulator YdfI